MDLVDAVVPFGIFERNLRDDISQGFGDDHGAFSEGNVIAFGQWGIVHCIPEAIIQTVRDFVAVAMVPDNIVFECDDRPGCAIAYDFGTIIVILEDIVANDDLAGNRVIAIVVVIDHPRIIGR